MPVRAPWAFALLAALAAGELRAADFAGDLEPLPPLPSELARGDLDLVLPNQARGSDTTYVVACTGGPSYLTVEHVDTEPDLLTFADGVLCGTDLAYFGGFVRVQNVVVSLGASAPFPAPVVAELGPAGSISTTLPVEVEADVVGYGHQATEDEVALTGRFRLDAPTERYVLEVEGAVDAEFPFGTRTAHLVGTIFLTLRSVTTVPGLVVFHDEFEAHTTGAWAGASVP